MNIEHRTLNVQHRIMYSVNLKNAEQNESTPQNSSVRLLKNRSSAATSIMDVRCWTFDVRRLICSLLRPGGVSYEMIEASQT